MDSSRSTRSLLATHGLRLLLLAQLAQFGALAVVPRFGPGASFVVTVLTCATYLAMLLVISGGRIFWVGVALLAPAVVSTLSEPLGLPEWMYVLALSAAVAFYALAFAVVVRTILGARRVTEDILAGAVCAYFLIALGFAMAFTLAEVLAPGSLRFGGGASSEQGLSSFVYFSLVTITTLGYGDVVPVAGFIRSLVILETVLGVLYPAIVVSRLVALFGAGEVAPEPPPGSWRELRYRNLAIVLAAGLLLLPVLRDNFFSGDQQILDIALLSALLYVVSHDRRLLRLGWGIVALAAVLQLLAGGEDELLAVGTGLELILYAAGLSIVFSSILRARRVERDTLYGAFCVYVLLGLAGASAFSLLEQLVPGSVSFPGEAPSPPGILYFSFMTLTTTGFGEVTPFTREAQILANFQATLGVFFPAILVARLVSLYGSEAE